MQSALFKNKKKNFSKKMQPPKNCLTLQEKKEKRSKKKKKNEKLEKARQQ